MSNLNSYHPFRASVQAGTVRNQENSGNSGSGSSSEEYSSKKSSEDEEKEYKPWFSWKTKLRMFIGSAASFILYFIGLSVYTGLAGEDKAELPAENTFLREMESNEEEGFMQEIFFDRNDLNERGRSVQEARQKAGFFKGFFCRGGKKSSFICN
jgi:hypothetical protein